MFNYRVAFDALKPGNKPVRLEVWGKSGDYTCLPLEESPNPGGYCAACVLIPEANLYFEGQRKDGKVQPMNPPASAFWPLGEGKIKEGWSPRLPSPETSEPTGPWRRQEAR